MLALDKVLVLILGSACNLSCFFAIIFIAFIKEYFVFILIVLGLALCAIALLPIYLGRRRARLETPRQARQGIPRNTLSTDSIESMGMPRYDSSVDPAIGTLFRADLMAWATKEYSYVCGRPEKLPDHIRLAYHTSDPRNLPYFGESRVIFSNYLEACSNPALLFSRDTFLDQVKQECDALIEFHRLTLSQEKRRLTHKDIYGNRFEEEWLSGSKGIRYFVDMVLVPTLGQGKWNKALALASVSKNHSKFYSDLLSRIDQAAGGEGGGDCYSESMDGIAYEDLCEDILTSKGWHVSRTPKSGDQGVDLIAERSDRRVCIQCKRYSSSVGNSAVQEVVAGKLHWGGSHAAVVSNADYTSSAKALADSAQVFLLHHDDLGRLDEIVADRGAKNRS